MSLFLYIAAVLGLAEGLRTRGQAAANVGASVPSNEAYTFHRFVRDFGRTYAAGSEEYARRAVVFQDSLSQIHAKNSHAGRSWTAGPYPFMDWTEAERAQRLHGYVHSLSRRGVAPTHLAAVQTGAGDATLPSVFENPAPPVRNQGACGSCWAIASVEAVESQLMKTNATMFEHKGSRLSPQALLNCVQNARHCGGNGGCTGATPQLAFDFIQNNGLPLEADVPYQQADDKCQMKSYPSNRAHATITGWRALPSNQAQPLMQAIVELGPVVVSVSAQKWYYYKLGVYDECEKDSIPNHSVLAKGYGGWGPLGKYWLLQNSWGDKWGEQGSIRILRHDDEDHWCGNDSDPQEGSACEGDSHQNVTVCGSCAILYDAVIPHVGRVVRPERAAGQDFHDAVADSSANLMLSTYAGASGATSGVAAPVQEALHPELANDDSNSFMKVQGLVSQRSAVAPTAGSDIDAADVLPSAQEFRSDAADESSDHDGLTWPPAQLALSAQSRGASPWAGILHSPLLVRDKAMLDLRADGSEGDAVPASSTDRFAPDADSPRPNSPLEAATDSAALHSSAPDADLSFPVSPPEVKTTSIGMFDSSNMHVHHAMDAMDAYENGR